MKIYRKKVLKYSKLNDEEKGLKDDKSFARYVLTKKLKDKDGNPLYNLDQARLLCAGKGTNPYRAVQNNSI